MLGMTVKSVYVKGVPYSGYVQDTVKEKTTFTGTVTLRGRFEEQKECLLFHVSKEYQKFLPAHYPFSDSISFRNETTAQERAAQSGNAECEITITDYQIEVSNDSIVTQQNEAGEIMEYTSDDSKIVLVQSANIV